MSVLFKRSFGRSNWNTPPALQIPQGGGFFTNVYFVWNFVEPATGQKQIFLHRTAKKRTYEKFAGALIFYTLAGKWELSPASIWCWS